MKMTRTTRGIRKVLIDLGKIDKNTLIRIRRTRAGRHQMAAGSWSWWAEQYIEGSGWMDICGAYEPAGEIIKAHRKGYVEPSSNSSGDLELDIEIPRSKEKKRQLISCGP
jgi:hypothetical protein